METEKRRRELLKLLQQEASPRTGAELASYFKVSRQVIVQDIAILRSSGVKIIATPQGYFIAPLEYNKWIQRVVVCSHTREEIESELGIIVDLGGKVLDVFVEHPVYGELRGNLMISSRRDLNLFLEHLDNAFALPLSALTDGVHMHTLEAPDEKVLEEILEALEKKGYLRK